MNLRSTTLALSAIGATVLTLTAATSAGAVTATDEDRAMVSVFHGVPGLTVDVYANGDELLPDFAPGSLTGPQPLEPGTYDIELFKAGADPDGEPALQKKVDVPAGANASLVAHLTEDGTPRLDAYVNDVSEVPDGKSRLTVRHVAAAPAVDVRADGKAVFKDLKNPAEATTEVNAGTVDADVVLAGTDTVAVGPAELPLREGTSNVVYAWGSAEDKNLALKVQTFEAPQSAPAGGGAGGTGSMAAAAGPNGSGPGESVAWPAWSAASAAVLAGAFTLGRRRAGTGDSD
ncbi:DUF4397 domain-containing protein [Streptomyces sp. GC420]|uniref:DUF4397 domain-containing protein n=1 Tax=Streptomyces sp. GC420 TaxID=2697568 RepID=UPI0014152D93|nr:DUF4397 domain-containing protein [Streptomyces sp. GC420]NBM20491.1 DUF4397 domain-containing protein [Streptomyces sp. GC420]